MPVNLASPIVCPCNRKKLRRVVSIRQKIDGRLDVKGKILLLFTDDPVSAFYRYGVLITDMDLLAANCGVSIEDWSIVKIISKN